MSSDIYISRVDDSQSQISVDMLQRADYKIN